MPGCIHPEIVESDDGPICEQCGTEVPDGRNDGSIPKDDLRELAEKWRNETEEGEYRHHYANELEALVGDK